MRAAVTRLGVCHGTFLPMQPAPLPASSTSSPAAALLAAQALACRRGRRLLFKGLDLQLMPGSITWLRGTNGSGKTSLMRILAGLSQPAEGTVLWQGQALAAARGSLVYIGHANALKEDLTLSEAVSFLGVLGGVQDAAAQTPQALERLGLASRRNAPVRTLSQGQRRRGALARLALDDAPRCWILDEPYDALDRASVDTLSALIEGHAARGGTVLLTSHQAVALAGAREFDLEAFRAP
jgi:heme exporter protein A